MKKFKSEEERKFWSAWKDAKHRCSNPNCKAYKNYGAKGITFCEEWDKYEDFYKDMWDTFIDHINKHKVIENGKVKYNTSLDRIDSSKGYNPFNCRWATNHQQELNKNNKNHYVAISLKTGNKYVFADNTAFCKANGFRRTVVSDICNGNRGGRKMHHGFTFRYAKPEERLKTIEEIENVIKIDFEKEV